MKSSVRFGVAIAVCAVALGACNPILRSHGYRYTLGEEPNIQPEIDNTQTVVAQLGNPSTRGVFEENIWYYISDTRETMAYLRPATRDRRILAIRFDEETGVVDEVAEYDLDDGRVVRYAARETPTRGRELTLLEQLLGNVGRLPSEQFGGEENLPGGAGGPRRNE